jgi:ATP-dependent DNA helicase RecQ
MPVIAPTESLSELLHRVFGHREFRAHQREVCEAATAGRDVLLVMPTGAGKSLCYQLPSLARGGTALVVSPLIALMDDQANKLSALGCRVARVHSGLSREDARQACRDYLDGQLDFLFIAPERMRVPGFPEMLAKRKPALVAIDEAHCISAWGHDFRPDYRTLGQHLPALRPAPILALTATATPTVQKDIAAQLQLNEPAIFITGFRRENLAVEAVELSKPQRPEFTLKLLRDASARPAIVYAASRKDADEIAMKLGKHFPAAAYHAGLGPAVRERVQREFLGGQLEVVVATVAFGMGVDKADVRTVVHVALPGSVEAFYQEIGRAGRDGLPSRTVLLHSFADRRTQEFFLEKNYPPVTDLERVAGLLTEEFVDVETVQRALGKKGIAMDREAMDRAVEKLQGVGVAEVDMSGWVRAGEGRRGLAAWKSGYDAQVMARRNQIDRMVAFAEGHQCRMTALVQHFGDTTDRRGPCGKCDVCNPAGATGGATGDGGHAPDTAECKDLRTILRALEGRGQSTGKLFTELKITKERADFDVLLEGLARAGLISIANDTFTNAEGKEITYRKATITHEGRDPDDATLATVWIRGGGNGGRATSKKVKKPAVADRSLTAEEEALEKRIWAWRSAMAKKSGAPAFTVFPDSTMRALAIQNPKTMADLRTIKGLGPVKVETLGAEILAVCRGDGTTESEPREQRPGVLAKPVAAKAIAVSASGAKSVVRETIHVPSAKQTPPKVFAPQVVELNSEQMELEEKLRLWRREEAAKAGLPSFFVFSDTVLRSVVLAKPVTVEALEGLKGVGREKAEKFGAAVVALCRG